MLITINEKLGIAFGPFDDWDDLNETARHYASVGQQPAFINDTKVVLLVAVDEDPEALPEEATAIEERMADLQARLDFLNNPPKAEASSE